MVGALASELAMGLGTAAICLAQAVSGCRLARAYRVASQKRKAKKKNHNRTQPSPVPVSTFTLVVLISVSLSVWLTLTMAIAVFSSNNFFRACYQANLCARDGFLARLNGVQWPTILPIIYGVALINTASNFFFTLALSRAFRRAFRSLIFA